MRHDVQFESDPPPSLAFKAPSKPTSAGIAVSGVGGDGQVVSIEL